MAIRVSIHSGFDQASPHLTVTESVSSSGECKITVYAFLSHEGETLEITHFEHLASGIPPDPISTEETSF